MTRTPPTSSDVELIDMGEHLSDETVEDLLSGNRDTDALGRLLGAIKAEFAAIDAPEPSPELMAFIDDAHHVAGHGSSPIDELSIARKRRRRLVAVAVTGTTVGKLMIGVSAAAASVAGMHATGLVDIPVLRDRSTPSEAVVADADRTPPDTLPISIAPATTVPADDLYSFDVDDAGTVEIGVTDAEVVTASAHARPGWTSEVDNTDSSVDIAFDSSIETLDVRAVLENDLLHVVISSRRTGDTREFWLDSDNEPTVPNQPGRPSPPLEYTPVPESDRTDEDSDLDDRNDSDDTSDDIDDDVDSDDVDDVDESEDVDESDDLDDLEDLDDLDESDVDESEAEVGDEADELRPVDESDADIRESDEQQPDEPGQDDDTSDAAPDDELD